MDRLNELRGEAGGSKDSTLDTTSPPSESFMSANESSSKYYSLSEVDSTFDISSIKDVSIAPPNAESNSTVTEGDELITNLSPIGKKSDMLDSYKIGKQIEAANILSGGVDIFDDNENSYDGDELVIDDNVEIDDKSNPEKSESVQFKTDENITESTLVDGGMDIASKDTEVVLQIDGKNVDAINIGNGLYLYRKEGQEELAVVQIIDDDQQQPSFKFLKVRENAEGNLEVYEEIEIEVPKDMLTKEEILVDKNTAHVPIKDINKVMSDSTCNKVAERKNKTQIDTMSISETEIEVKEVASESKSEVNLNGKMMKFSESRKSPVIGSFTPMTYHSTPNKEGKPLTKTMVDLQLHPNRHSDNVKKTIEVHTDSCKQRLVETQSKCKDVEDNQANETAAMHKEEPHEKNYVLEEDEKLGTKCLDKKNLSGNTEEDNIENNKNKSVETITESPNNNVQQKVDQEIDKDTSKSTTLEESKGEVLHEIVENNIESNKAEAEIESVKEIKSDKANTKETITMDDQKIKETNKVAEIKSVIKVEDIEISSCALPEPSSPGKEQEDKKTNEAIPTSLANTQSSQNKPKSNLSEETESSVNENVSVSENIETTIQKITESGVNENLPISENIETPIQKITNMLESKDQVDCVPISENVSNTEEECSKVGNIKEQHETPMEDTKSFNKNEEKTENATLCTSKVNIIEKILSDDPKNVLEIEKAESPNNTTDTITSPQNDNIIIDKNGNKDKTEPHNKKEVITVTTAEVKPTNNNNAAVPFGKWTDINRQEFLNKFKETKIPVNSSNGKQIKNSNDLNRRDVLKKIDSQRQSNTATTKAQDLPKTNIKKEGAFSSKTNTTSPDIKTPLKCEAVELTSKPATYKKVQKDELPQSTKSLTSDTVVAGGTKIESIIESTQRREVNTQDLIDKTIEGMISRLLVKGTQDESKQESKDSSSSQKLPNAYEKSHPTETSLDEIEMKMNELHGIPFIERPPHELPRVYKPEVKNYTKVEKDVATDANIVSKIPSLLPFAKNQSKSIKDNVIDVDSEEEIIEHEPITGDIEITKSNKSENLFEKQIPVSESGSAREDINVPKSEAIITENEFDKFARRNSITYQNCITVNFDSKEPLNVIKAVKGKDIAPKTYSRNEILRIDTKSKLPHKPQNVRHNIHSSKAHTVTKFGQATEDSGNKNYQSKLQLAYQTALTAKRQLDRPITIIEDKPVKVVFMDPNTEFIPSQLNVQGQELSPIKKQIVEPDATTVSTCDSLDSDVFNTIDDEKSQDEVKTKTKHQRKQVLTPVEAPELELIEPGDIGVEVSPKKKRKTEDIKAEKSAKNLMHKKSYLLGRSLPADDKTINSQEFTQTLSNDTVKEKVEVVEVVMRKDASSAIDNLVKAAELLETQAENMSTSTISNTDSQQNTPVKRGRGRPRKYPLPEGATDNRVPSPQKKPRLIDAKHTKPDIVTDDDSSDGEMIRENWTMGKINENIVCPICNKLFRSENVVFKHVKHCTGPSPNRSDSDKRSPRRMRHSQESDTKSHDGKLDTMEVDEEKKRNENKKYGHVKRKSKDSVSKSDSDKPDVIVIEDIPAKEKPQNEEAKQHESRKIAKTKIPHIVNNLVCEFCGKTFRQLSYLNSHKLQHKKEESKKSEKESEITNKSVFNCEVCKKDFRKLHHLVQHRIIHNPNAMPTRVLRKSSSEQSDKSTKEQKQSEDSAAGFRCEPCDKSFRKLHHLVEHRETHDGINRQKSISATNVSVEKLPPPPQCEICKKTFRKLHHLVEHKEQHADTGSEKSDDKSVKSSLSTKDIIHECSLCYMVFPNEHSLNKHTIICLRKKRQSKQAKQAGENGNENTEESESEKTPEQNKIEDIEPKLIASEIKSDDYITNIDMTENPEEPVAEKLEEVQIIKNYETPETAAQKETIENPIKLVTENKPAETQISSVKLNIEESENFVLDLKDAASEVPEKIPKIDDKGIMKTQETPKKKEKVALKEKIASTVPKRQKTNHIPHQVLEEVKPSVESSDDDEIRYMFNPDFKVDDTSEGKLFMKVRAKKRNSLQIERPSSREMVKRRTSLQHPPKIPRLKAKPVEIKNTPNNAISMKMITKISKLETVPSSDSDDSDVKYSFPKTAPEKTIKQDRTPKDTNKRAQRKSLAEKRKSLSAIAKRKSLGKAVTARHKIKASPIKPVTKRKTDPEHRCDCGQLFSSAALLSRHVTLTHTPPRIRRRRSPPPEIDTKTVTKTPTRKSTVPDKKQTVNLRKSSVKSDTSNANSKASIPRKSSVTKSDAKTANDARKSIKSTDTPEASSSASCAKTRRNTAHKGVPVPEKMKKLMQKTKN